MNLNLQITSIIVAMVAALIFLVLLLVNVIKATDRWGNATPTKLPTYKNPPNPPDLIKCQHGLYKRTDKDPESFTDNIGYVPFNNDLEKEMKAKFENMQLQTEYWEDAFKKMTVATQAKNEEPNNGFCPVYAQLINLTTKYTITKND